MNDVFEYVFPGLMLMWICFIANGSFVDIFEEYKAQTIARMITSGVTMGEILVSKILRCLAICWICQVLLIVFTGMVFNVGWRNPIMLFCLLTSFNLCLIGILSLIYGYARSTEAANGIVVLFVMVSAFLGGSFIPFPELPQSVQNIGQWTMIRMSSSGMESLFRGRPIGEVTRSSLLLTAIGLIMMVLGVRVLRRRFESGNVA